MRTKLILNPEVIKRTTFTEAESAFYKRCKLKNLAEKTIAYYQEDIRYFHAKMPVKYIDEITAEKYEDFIFSQLEQGKKATSLNSRIRGLRVFFKFCAEREYMEPFDIKLMKEDEVIKEPYTEAELLKLLQKPKSNRWAVWRTWAAINYLLSTGNRASTALNVQICNIDFDEMTIKLTKVKNRHQQIVPLSPALKEVLQQYLETWEWKPEDYLFPTYEGTKMNVRSFQGAVARYNVSRGVSKTSVHLFRHTFAKNFVMAGGGLVQLQTLLGHSTLDMSRHYVDIYGMDLQKDYEKLNPLDTIMQRRA